MARSANANPTPTTVAVVVGVEDDEAYCCWVASDILTASAGVFDEVEDVADESMRGDCDNEGGGNGISIGVLSLDSKPAEGNNSQMIRPTLTGSSSVPLTKLLLRRRCDGRRGLKLGEALTLLVLEVVEWVGRLSVGGDCEGAMGIDGFANVDDDDLDSVEGWGIDGARSIDDDVVVGTMTFCSTRLDSDTVSTDVSDADGVKGCA